VLPGRSAGSRSRVGHLDERPGGHVRTTGQTLQDGHDRRRGRLVAGQQQPRRRAGPPVDALVFLRAAGIRPDQDDLVAGHRRVQPSDRRTRCGIGRLVIDQDDVHLAVARPGAGTV
jgi:hypothetical protein